MANCCVGGCTKKFGSALNGESDFRRFIRFYHFPKEKVMQKKWIARVLRRPEDINPESMYVCSDHFEDEDYIFRSLQQADFFSQELLKGLKILLKKDAVPNTDRSTGQARKGRPPAKKSLKREASDIAVLIDPPCSSSSSTSTGLAISSKSRAAKRSRRLIDFENLDELIAENQRLVEVKQVEIETATGMEILEEQVQGSNQFTSTLDFELAETDKSVQANVASKTRGIQVGQPSSFLSQKDPPVYDYNNTSASESDVEDVLCEDPDYTPQDKSSLAKLNFTRHYSFKKKTAETKSHLSFPVSKVIVGCEQLSDLFKFCGTCGNPVLEKSVRYDGALLTISYTCQTGHNVIWRSGDYKHHQALINIELVGAAKMNGVGFTALHDLFKTLEIPFMSSTTYYDLAKRWIFPVILKEFVRVRTEIITELKITDHVMLCGDAQFDSPGFSAKFCTYTIMDCRNNKVVDTIVIQKGQYSGELEKQACQELLNILIIEDGLKISKFVNDRHQGIGKMMREQYPSIYHAYDVWHMAKSLRKKLTKISKKNPKIGLWNNQLVNHLWWSSENCGKDPELLLEMFHSCLFHVLNIHKWRAKKVIHRQFAVLRGTKPYPKTLQVDLIPEKPKSKRRKKDVPQPPPMSNLNCWHPTITNGRARKAVWFKIKEDDFKALFKAITATKFSNDLRKCSEFLHTGALESLHSTKIKYLPKSTAYKMDTSIIMTMFAVLIHNNLQSMAPSKRYEVRDYSRASKQYRIKTKVVKDIIPFKKSLLSEIVGNVNSNTLLPIDLNRYIRKPVPRTFHGVDKPSLASVKNKSFSRMGN